MNALQIRGGRRLAGEWTVHSAKNAALPIMAASILTDETTLLEACPRLSDIGYMGDILKNAGLPGCAGWTEGWKLTRRG